MAGASDAALNIVLSTKDETGPGVASAEGKLAKLKNSVANMSAMWSALGAASTAAIGFLSDAANAAADDQASTDRLSQALKNAGAGYDATSPKIQNLISTNQDLAFTDDDTRDSLALLVAETGNVDEAMRRQKLAMDLSRGSGMDLMTASKLLGKVTDDNIGVLKRYGIDVKAGAFTAKDLATATTSVTSAEQANATAKQHLQDVQAALHGKTKLTLSQQIQLRDANKAVTDTTKQVSDAKAHLTEVTQGQVDQEALFAAVQAKFGGQSQTYADSTAGWIARMKDKISEWKESIGASLGPAQGFIALLPSMSAGFSLAGTLLGPLVEGIKALGNTSLVTAAKQKIASAATAAWSAVVGLATFAQDLNTFALQRGYFGTLKYIASLALAKAATLAGTVATTASTVAGNVQAAAQGAWALVTGGWTAATGAAAAMQNAFMASSLRQAAVSGVVRGATLIWTGVQWLLNAALTANPIGIVVVAIAALVAGIIWAYQNVGWFHDAVDKGWEKLKQFGAWLQNSMAPILKWLGDRAADVASFFNKIGEYIQKAHDLHIPGFSMGGLVVGQQGAATLILAHGGEAIVPAQRPGEKPQPVMNVPGAPGVATLVLARAGDTVLTIGENARRESALNVKAFAMGGTVTSTSNSSTAVAVTNIAKAITSRALSIKGFAMGGTVSSSTSTSESSVSNAVTNVAQSIANRAVTIKGFAMGGVVPVMLGGINKGGIAPALGGAVHAVKDSAEKGGLAIKAFVMGGTVGDGAVLSGAGDSPSAAAQGDTINVDVKIGTYVGDASKLSKLIAHELKLAGAFA